MDKFDFFNILKEELDYQKEMWKGQFRFPDDEEIFHSSLLAIEVKIKDKLIKDSVISE